MTNQPRHPFPRAAAPSSSRSEPNHRGSNKSEGHQSSPPPLQPPDLPPEAEEKKTKPITNKPEGEVDPKKAKPREKQI